jgi:hypothetical protein
VKGGCAGRSRQGSRHVEWDRPYRCNKGSVPLLHRQSSLWCRTATFLSPATKFSALHLFRRGVRSPISTPRRPPSVNVRHSRGGGGGGAGGGGATPGRRRPAGLECRKRTSSTWRWRARPGRAWSRCVFAPATRRFGGRTHPPGQLGAHRAGACRRKLGPRRSAARWSQRACSRHRCLAGCGLRRTSRPGVYAGWRAWRLVIPWAVARKAVQDILPMSLDTLKALLTWDVLLSPARRSSWCKSRSRRVTGSSSCSARPTCTRPGSRC